MEQEYFSDFKLFIKRERDTTKFTHFTTINKRFIITASIDYFQVGYMFHSKGEKIPTITYFLRTDNRDEVIDFIKSLKETNNVDI